MPGESSCGRDSLQGKQGDMQAVTQSPFNSPSGAGSNASSFLAALRMEWRCKGGVHPQAHGGTITRQLPDVPVLGSSPSHGQDGPGNLRLCEAVTQGRMAAEFISEGLF